MKIKKLELQLKVKKFYVSDQCANCGSPQGGYANANLDRYLNVRDGHNCANCGVSEEVTNP